jgi:CHAT domain-containing protein
LGIWVYDNQKMFGRWIPLDTEELNRKSIAFTELCAQPTSSLALVRQQATELYRVLLKSIDDWLPADRRWVIEADRALASLPIEALLDRNDHYVIQNHTLTWSRGVYFANWATSDAQATKSDSVLVVAAPAVAQFNGEILDSLPDALSEGQKIAKRYARSQLIVGEHATIRSVSQGLRHAVLFHYAGHAVTEAAHPGLLLVSDSPGDQSGALLTAPAVEKLHLHGMRMAVLAACSTQRGSDGGTFDPDSLARAFLLAGAKEVVSSRWNVDSSVTSSLLDTFYRRLSANHSASDSLRMAAEAVREGDETRHPFYWAGFTVIGDS